VVIIADTCHSAAIGGGIGRRSAGDEAQAINAYLEEVRKSKGGVALLTSAEASEVSREDAQWGDGHGVFTYYLLEGMRGAADGFRTTKDGVVSVGELFDYVREQVQRATANQQHPCIGTSSFDRALPMAITAGISAHEHYELGRQLYQLGLLLDDRHRFEAASRQLTEALRLARSAGIVLPEASLYQGLALLAAGDYKRAIEAFTAAMQQDGTIPDATYYLGFAYAKQGDHARAAQTLEVFLSSQPHDSRADWVRAFLAWYIGPQTDARYALLIGIATYADPSIPALRGPLNDVQLMHELLVQRHGFPEANIVTLTDAAATRQGILAALDALAEKTKPADSVMIYYSGHAPAESSDAYLIVYDTTLALDSATTIRAHELHMLVNGIPGRTTLILDTHANAALIELARQEGHYTLWLGTSPGQMSYENSIDDGEHRYFVGAFTYAFADQLRQSQPDTTQGHLRARVVDAVQKAHQQTPLLVGNETQRIFGTEDYRDLFDFSQRRNYSAMERGEIHQRYAAALETLAAPFPQLHYAFGRAFLKWGSYPQALRALQTAVEQSQQSDSESLFALGMAQLRTQHYAEAETTLQRYLAAVDSPTRSAHIQEPLIRLGQLQHARKHALLIGINDYINRDIPNLRGAANDARALKNTLVQACGFQDADIQLLIDGEATYQNLITAFKNLAEQAHAEPALFYFAGRGSFSTDNAPTIVSADGRQPHIFDIELRELAVIVGAAPTNLVTLFDVGWSKMTKTPSGGRSLPNDPRPRIGARALLSALEAAPPAHATLVLPRIGCLTIYQESLDNLPDVAQSFKVEAQFPALRGDTGKKIYGTLTYALIRSLQEATAPTLTYAQLIQAVSEKLKPSRAIAASDNLNVTIFSNSVAESTIYTLLTRINEEPIMQMIQLSRRLIEQRNDIDPEGYLNLGVAYAVLGEYDKSLEALSKAIDQQGETYADAQYYLGRVHFESKRDLNIAISALRLATQYDPDNAPAYYYLGQAIRALVERETLAEAEQALQTYLKAGAPLGHTGEVQQFLSSRKTAPTNSPK